MLQRFKYFLHEQSYIEWHRIRKLGSAADLACIESNLAELAVTKGLFTNFYDILTTHPPKVCFGMILLNI